MAPGGVWEGNLYLYGGGDPTFGSSGFIASHYGGVGSPVSALAGQLRAVGIRRVSGQVMGDEAAFDSLRGEPSSDYAPDPFLEGSLSALAFNRGESGSERGTHAPAAYAARQLRAALRTDGVHVSGSGGAVTALPSGAIQLATLPSPTIAQLVGLMLPPSDNFFAEMLVKAMGARLGGAGTTPAGVRVVSSTIASLLGIHPPIYDGSGLSEADRTSPYQVGDMLVALYPTPIGALLRARMAVAGRSGTLETRMRKTAAAGRCVGKTGTLTGVSNLVGYCPSSNGHVLAFAIFTDGDRNRRRPHLPGPHRDHPRGLGPLAPSEQLLQAGFVEHGHSQPLGLLELRARALSRHQVVGLARYRARHATPRGHDPLGGLLAGEHRQGPRQHQRTCRPGDPRRAPGRSRRSSARARAARRSACACARPAAGRGSRRAIFSPTPGVSAICSGVAAISVSMSRIRCTRLRAVTSPTSSIPSANSTLAKGRCLEASIAASSLRAEISAKPSSSSSCSSVRR